MTAAPFAGLEMKQADRNRTNLPGGGTLAQMIRDHGATVDTIAALHDTHRTHIYSRLRNAGYAPDGYPRQQQMEARPKEAAFIHQSEPWLTERACVDADPEVFHDNRQTKLAREICAACPVATLCLEYALRVEDATAGRYGVYGGLTGDERAQLVKTK